MNSTPYSRFNGGDLILRDELAIDRTLLANERTLMAYLRSGVALLIAGVSIMHFSSEGWFWMVGLACILISLPFSYFVTKRINDTPENQRDIKNLEEFVEKFKRQ